MKTFFSWMLAAALMLSMASPAMAARRRVKTAELKGEVTEAHTATITVKGKKLETISVPTGTPITGGGSTLESLVGKQVTIKEKSPGVAKEIVVGGGKKGKGTKTKSASTTTTATT